jgi:glutamate racemase
VADAPIGIFDSGVGGLTVARAVLDSLPHEQVLYMADTARQPYGPKPIADVRRFALECIDSLVDSGIKALVIACNSASAAMLRDARERYDIPVVEVIRPAVRRAVATTKNGHVGVIGTQATVTSGAYEDAFAAAPHLKIFTQACPRFVELVEAGITTGREVVEVAHDYLDPMVATGVDTIVLGCTHYPLLAGAIQYVVGEQVALVNSADETARELYRVLSDNGLLRDPGLPEPHHTFLATGDATLFTTLRRRFLAPEIDAAA